MSRGGGREAESSSDSEEDDMAKRIKAGLAAGKRLTQQLITKQEGRGAAGRPDQIRWQHLTPEQHQGSGEEAQHTAEFSGMDLIPASEAEEHWKLVFVQFTSETKIDFYDEDKGDKDIDLFKLSTVMWFSGEELFKGCEMPSEPPEIAGTQIWLPLQENPRQHITAITWAAEKMSTANWKLVEKHVQRYIKGAMGGKAEEGFPVMLGVTLQGLIFIIYPVRKEETIRKLIEEWPAAGRLDMEDITRIILLENARIFLDRRMSPMVAEEEGFTPVSLHESDDLEMTPTERRVQCRKCGDIIGFFCGCSIDCSCFQSAADDHLRQDQRDGLSPPTEDIREQSEMGEADDSA